MVTRSLLYGGATVLALAYSGCALAQSASTDELLAMSVPSLRSEVERRHDEAVALSQDQGVVAADSMRFMWASQAKAQCGIAVGYTKSGYKDPISVGKCIDAHLRMQNVVPQPQPIAAPPTCEQPIPGLIFFEWDSAIPPAETDDMLNRVVSNMPSCGWSRVEVIGHTDRSGADGYNEALAMRRARNMAQLLIAKGIAENQVAVIGMGERSNRVPTDDGVRERQNRGVEVTVK